MQNNLIKQLPEKFLLSLDFSEFFPISKEVCNVVYRLEEEFKQFVMPYKRSIFRRDIPISKHLCARLLGAFLSNNQKEFLNNYERKFSKKNISFVIYQKPITYISVSQSPFFNQYANPY